MGTEKAVQEEAADKCPTARDNSAGAEREHVRPRRLMGALRSVAAVCPCIEHLVRWVCDKDVQLIMLIDLYLIINWK